MSHLESIVPIRVLLFGVLAERQGGESIQIEWRPGDTVDDLLARVAGTCPELRPLLPQVVCAVNHEYASGDRAIEGGDEVALVPPVSGG